MQSVNLSNPIYQHSGESEKLKAIAQQASVTEDMEQRRRQLDSKGENRRILVAKEVAGMVEQYGGRVHLKATPFEIPKEPIISQATNAASSFLHSALDAGKNLLNSATSTTKGVADSTIHLGQDAAGYVASTTKGVADSALHLGQDAAGYVSSTTKGVADSAIHLGQDAAGFVSTTTKGAADYITHTAQEAAHQASDLATIAANKSKDLASTAASKTKAIADVATTKAHEIADVATNKAHEIADNIKHFTTLVSVLADEENERARRIISGDEARAASNAFRVSELIRELGPAFYKQTPNLSYTTKILEEAERRWRLNSTHASLAETNAHNVGKLVSKSLQNFMPRYQWVRSHINTIEEKERTRRLNDSNETYSIMNALRLSEIIRDLGLGFYRQEGTFTRTHAAYATTLLEEVERKDRIRLDKLHHAEDQAHLLSDVVANNMEKFNYTTRNAAQFANEFAKMLSTATKNVASNFAHLTQDFAKTATVRAKEVASDIASYSTRMYVVALEERERARRLSDSNEINAISNAWNQSALIRELGSLYRPSSLARFPIGLIEEQERRWRLSSLPSKSSKKLNEIVLANLAKFEAASSGSKKLNDIVLSNRNKFEAASSGSKKINDIVLSNLDKFECASSKLGEVEHAKDTAVHSKLNPNAPTFVPHQAFTEIKQEPIIEASIPRAAGAQF